MITLTINEKDYLIPENATELPWRKFDQIKRLIASNDGMPFTKQMVLDITSIVSGLDVELLLDSPAAFYDIIVDKTKWVYALDMSKYKVSDYIEIDGERFSYETQPSKITLREWSDIDTILSKFKDEDKDASIMAVRLRKVEYKLEEHKDDKGIVTGTTKLFFNKIEKYNTDMIDERKEMFKNLPTSTIFPLLSFFLSNGEQYSNNIRIYSLMVGQALERQFQLEDWVRNTDGGRPLSNWRKTTYLKWMKFLTNQLEQHVHFSHSLSQKIEPKTKP